MIRYFDRGDIVWADLDPAIGREQAKHRPYLVLSEAAQHKSMELVLAVPLTTANRPWPTRIRIDNNSNAICEQARTFSTNRITRIERRGYDVSVQFGKSFISSWVGDSYPGKRCGQAIGGCDCGARGFWLWLMGGEGVGLGGG